MPTPERLYRTSVRAFSAIFVFLGLAILISTLANGGGILSLGVVLGVAFLAVGIVRGWLGGGGPPWRRTTQRGVRAHGGGRQDRTRGRSHS